MVLASAFLATSSRLKRAMAGVWFSGRSLLGSTGGWPPFGEASVSSTPASRKTKYGAANSSSQNPVLRPVLPNWSCDVSTMRIFITVSLKISGLVFRSHELANQRRDFIGGGVEREMPRIKDVNLGAGHVP